MSQSHGSNADVIGNGFVLSQFLNSATVSGSRETAEGTTFKSKSKSYIPGLKDASMSLAGIFEGQVNLVDDILFAAFGLTGSGIYTYVPVGQEVAGAVGWSIVALEGSYEINTAVGDIAQVSAELSGGSGGDAMERGPVVHPLFAEVAAGNGTTLDNGAVAGATTNGASLVVHVTAAAAGSSMFLQDSADGTTWADLAGSIAIPIGRSSGRLFVSGTIRRYTRVRWTGAATFIALINRK